MTFKDYSQPSWGANLLPTPEQRRAAQPNIYAGSHAYGGLQSYASAPQRSEYEQRPGESDDAYVNHRLKPLIHHLTETLPADELERVVASHNAAVERINSGVPSHEQLRASLDSRTTGTVHGLATAQQRAAALGNRGMGSGRDIAANGHLVSRVLTTAGQPSLSLLDRLPKRDQPMFARTDVSGMRSTGAGILGVDR